MLPNPLREHFDGGRVALGGWLDLPSPIAAEIMAGLALDYACVDMQHGLIDYPDTVALLTALSGHRITPIVRVPWNQPDYIGKALDAGAFGVIVPMVNSTEECQQAVLSARYPPAGVRSYGPVRAAIVDNDYFSSANPLIIPMIETTRALDQLDGILGVDGVAAAYVGPADLAISMGFKPGSNEPEFLGALEKIVDRCVAHGVVPGIHATAATAVDRIERGFRMVTVTTDIVALRTGLADDVGAVRAHYPTGPSRG